MAVRAVDDIRLSTAVSPGFDAATKRKGGPVIPLQCLNLEDIVGTHRHTIRFRLAAVAVNNRGDDAGTLRGALWHREFVSEVSDANSVTENAVSLLDRRAVHVRSWVCFDQGNVHGS